MSNIKDDKTYSDITYDEWKYGQDAIVSLMNTENATQEQLLQFAKFNQTVKNGYEGLKRN